MSACAMQTFNNVTRAAWTCVQSAAAQYGITAVDSGEASVEGFTMTWFYVEDTGTLQIQCTDSPWFVPCETINAQISATVEACLSEHNSTTAAAAPG